MFCLMGSAAVSAPNNPVTHRTDYKYPGVEKSAPQAKKMGVFLVLGSIVDRPVAQAARLVPL